MREAGEGIFTYLEFGACALGWLPILSLSNALHRHDDVPRLARDPHLEQRHLARAETRHPHLLYVPVRHAYRPSRACAVRFTRLPS